MSVVEGLTIKERYMRALNDQTDLYVVWSGPNEARGFGENIALFFEETEAGRAYDHSRVAAHSDMYADFDPQPPHLLTYEELGSLLVEHLAAAEENVPQ